MSLGQRMKRPGNGSASDDAQELELSSIDIPDVSGQLLRLEAAAAVDGQATGGGRGAVDRGK